MKTRALKVLLLIETFIIVLQVLWLCFAFKTKGTILLRETSPDGNYRLFIEEIGIPNWPFGDDHLRISLYEGEHADLYRVSFDADVANNGRTAAFEVEWMEDRVQIALKGSKQPTTYYILPFKTLDD